jgi:4-hydroxybenzoate polyprenyltransferase/phosphoserine phosphatase
MDQRVTELGAGTGRAVPLVVDLDGTLLATDTLHEGFLALLGARPVRALAALAWLGAGRAAFKDRVAAESPLDVGTLPARPEVVALIEDARAEGRPVVLATAANRRWAEAAAARFGPFDAVVASDGSTNLSGPAKAEALERAFGAGGFDYVGDSGPDVAVWARARHAVVVGPGGRMRVALAAIRPDFAEIDTGAGDLGTLTRALRVHQWVKNLLVFLPALAAHRAGAGDLAVLAATFLAFCAAASAVYLCNDLLDLAADRDHPRKRKRPFASGQLPVAAGMRLVPALFAVAFAIAVAAGPPVAATLAAYVVATFAYSLWLKRQPIVDVMTLAGLYTMRVFAGAAALGLTPSPWLLGFCVFLFLCLALVKRLTEIRSRLAEGRGDPVGRGYRLDDAPVVLMLAAAAGYASVLVLALYVDSVAMQRLYETSAGLWAIAVLLLFWLSRLILVAQRGEMHDDPIVFAAGDGVSRVVAALVLVAVAGSL